MCCSQTVCKSWQRRAMSALVFPRIAMTCGMPLTSKLTNRQFADLDGMINQFSVVGRLVLTKTVGFCSVAAHRGGDLANCWRQQCPRSQY